MTETQLSFTDLKQRVSHLSEKREEGMVLTWGSDAQNQFQVLCKGNDPEKAYQLDRILTEAYDLAVERMR